MGSTRERWRRCWRFRSRPGTDGAGRRRVRNWIGFTGIIDEILVADEGRPRKQRHTSKRIFERLRDEHGYVGGITIVKDYVLARWLRHREVFVPLRQEGAVSTSASCL